MLLWCVSEIVCGACVEFSAVLVDDVTVYLFVKSLCPSVMPHTLIKLNIPDEDSFSLVR